MKEDFEELMSNAFKQMTVKRQLLRLRYLKIQREIENGKQKKL